MFQLYLKNIVRFVIFILVQVWVLNNIQFLGFINPYIYILFILSLPVKTNRWIVLLLSFVLGICIDMFSDTLGLHAFATVLVGFLRTPVTNLIVSNEDNVNLEPSFKTFGVSSYVKYVVILILIHHFTLFYLEAFTLAHFWITLCRALLSSITTILLILGIQLLKRN